MINNHLLYRIENLSVEYKTRAGILNALDNITLDIYRGEVLGLVGESGCGKSTFGMALMRMIQPPGRIIGGELWFDGINLMKLSPDGIRQIRGNQIGMVFQDPMTSLNPVQRVIDHITETVRIHDPMISQKGAEDHAADLIDRLGISRNRLNDYPHQLSGGMRQRVMISLALALRASLVIADEATTSLDVIVEAQFLDLLKELKDEFNLTILLITHNIGLVAELADRVAVMYAGRLTEVGTVTDLFHDPKHPYAVGLLNAVPNIKIEDDVLYKMPGAPPDLITPPVGCRFHPRCPQVMDICRHENPPFKMINPGRSISCWLFIDVKQSIPNPERAFE